MSSSTNYLESYPDLFHAFGEVPARTSPTTRSSGGDTVMHNADDQEELVETGYLLEFSTLRQPFGEELARQAKSANLLPNGLIATRKTAEGYDESWIAHSKPDQSEEHLTAADVAASATLVTMGMIVDSKASTANIKDAIEKVKKKPEDSDKKKPEDSEFKKKPEDSELKFFTKNNTHVLIGEVLLSGAIQSFSDTDVVGAFMNLVEKEPVLLGLQGVQIFSEDPSADDEALKLKLSTWAGSRARALLSKIKDIFTFDQDRSGKGGICNLPLEKIYKSLNPNGVAVFDSQRAYFVASLRNIMYLRKEEPQDELEDFWNDLEKWWSSMNDEPNAINLLKQMALNDSNTFGESSIVKLTDQSRDKQAGINRAKALAVAGQNWSQKKEGMNM